MDEARVKLTLQGQSAATIDKERRIGSALSIGMQIASRPHFAGRGYRYWHFDANAGCGWNDNANVPGSPIVFWQCAKAWLKGLEPMPFFCDMNQTAIFELHKALSADSIARDKSFLIPGDNEEAIEVFAETIRQSNESANFATGSVLIDPNGYFYRNLRNEGAPTEALKWFTKEFPRIDIIINFNIRAYSLQKPHEHAVEPVRSVLTELGKKQWLVGRTTVGQSRFLLAIGRNFQTGDHKRLHLYDSISAMGNWLLDWAEGKRQQEISYDLSNIQRISLTPSISRSEISSNAPIQRQVLMRGDSQRSPSSQIPSMEHVRRSIEPQTDLPQLPLFGAWEE